MTKRTNVALSFSPHAFNFLGLTSQSRLTEVNSHSATPHQFWSITLRDAHLIHDEHIYSASTMYRRTHLGSAVLDYLGDNDLPIDGEEFLELFTPQELRTAGVPIMHLMGYAFRKDARTQSVMGVHISSDYRLKPGGVWFKNLITQRMR